MGKRWSSAAYVRPRVVQPAVSQASVITRSPGGGYEVTTRATEYHLSTVLCTPRHASTLWGARRLARKHQKYLARTSGQSAFREEIR